MTVAGAHTGQLDILDRAMHYALRAVNLYEYLHQQPRQAAWIMGKQYLRAATSIGANLEEAQAGESRQDFIHKCAIAQKEARESRYWLRLLMQSELVPAARIEPLLQETEEIVAIVTTIIVNTKSSAKK